MAVPRHYEHADSEVIQDMDNNNLNTKEHFQEQLDLIIEHLKALPSNELSYYMALMTAIIQNEPDAERHTFLLIEANKLLSALQQFYDHFDEAYRQEEPFNVSDDLRLINENLQSLLAASQMRTFSHRVKKALLAACSVILGFVVGIFAACVGLVAGFFSDYTIIGNFYGAYLGVITGIGLGMFIGSRIPDVIFQSDFERKFEFAIAGIEKVAGELPSKQSEADYAKKAKEYILKHHFPDVKEEEKEETYNKFLASEQAFQVCTTTSRFIDKRLKGHLGHHTLIRYEINGIAHVPLEFFGDKSKMPAFVDQYETPRIVTGQKLAEMIAFDMKLTETHQYTFTFVVEDYDLGSNDCRDYGNKILVATHQAPIHPDMSRFNPNIDSWIGTYIAGPFVRFFSKTREDELEPFIRYYDDGKNYPTVTGQKWPGKKTRPIPEEWEAREKAAKEAAKAAKEVAEVNEENSVLVM